MKVVILYHPASEWARDVETYARDFERTQGHQPELLSVDTREGAAIATLYDVIRYPAVMVMKDDGQMQQLWQGEQLPLMNEVVGYMHA